MAIRDIVQKTEITVSFYAEDTTEHCESMMDKIMDDVFTIITKEYSDKAPKMDWEKEKNSEDYILTIEENGTIKYYPGSYWDPDEWDDPTTLQDCDFEAIMDELYKGSDDVCSYYVNSDWEVD